MEIKCSFCDAVDEGSQDELQERGWSKAIFFTPVRKTIITCRDHYIEFNRAIMELMRPEKVVGK